LNRRWLLSRRRHRNRGSKSDKHSEN
jgi:hypothetical protein